ncbi:MAG: MerR family transcriptional regulator [Saprospiraceae bacterium]|nr:MerR family transcriptional regulator [Saprospiraceae bacterium]
MAIYSIKDLEKLSGIKAHTIRIWEQRYDVIQPKRTRTNIRYYNEEDLRNLLNIAMLNKNGFKISKIAKMSKLKIAEEVAQISEVHFDHATQLDVLTLSMIEMDEYKFDKIISTNIDQLGFEKTMIDIINPFLDKLSVLWLTSSINPAQEHFISCLIRQKLIVAVDKLPFPNGENIPKYLVYLPEGEIHELSILFVNYLLRKQGNYVIYLGQNIPFIDLEAVFKIHHPEYIFTMFSGTFLKEPVQDYLKKLTVSFPNTQVLVSGYQVLAYPIKLPENVSIIESFDHFIGGLKN